MPSPRIIFFNRFYAPEEPATAQLLTDLAEGLAADGREVVVVTSVPRNRALPSRETSRGVAIHRVRGTKFGNRNVLYHACDFATFALASLFHAARLLRRNDTVVLMTDPPLLAVPLSALAHLRGARVVHWLQDIYPEAATLLSGWRIFNLLTPIRNLAWRSSDACVFLGEDNARNARDAQIPQRQLHLVPNWAPAGIVPFDQQQTMALRADWGLTGKFVIAYFGNLGRVHDLDPILDVAEKLRIDPAFVFLFVGPGAQRAPLEAAAQKRGLSNVRFFPAQPRERRSEILALGDIHLVTLRPGCERVVYPSKLYSICAARRPVLFVGSPDSAIAQEISTRSLGLAFSRADIDAIAATLRELRAAPDRLAHFASAAYEFYAHEGSLPRALERWRQVLAVVEGNVQVKPSRAVNPTRATPLSAASDEPTAP